MKLTNPILVLYLLYDEYKEWLAVLLNDLLNKSIEGGSCLE